MKRKQRVVLTLLLIVFCLGFSFSGSPADTTLVFDKIRALGMNATEETISTTAKLYLPLHAQTSTAGITITKDQRYGPHERHRLDIYRPAKKTNTPQPILVFLHGGAFIAGDKSLGGIYAPYYANLGCYFARQGLVTIIPTYRLAPEYQWPSGAEDLAAVLQWLRSNGRKYGGDRDQVFLMGHSAGAVHVATYIFHEDLQLTTRDGVVGAVLLSGMYDPRVTAVPPEANTAYYGNDASKYASMAALRHVEGRAIPVFIAFAEFDPDFFQMQAAELFQALCRRDNTCPRIKQIPHHNHFSEIYHINTTDESIGPDIVDFVRSLTR